MKRMAVFYMFLWMGIMAASADFETATQAVGNMRVGWNIGNTMDSNSGDTLNMWIEHWTDRTPTAYEKAWGQQEITPELIRLFKNAGFNAIRLPVTWYPHMEAKFNFSTWENSYWYPSRDDIGTKVDATWMRRVHEVVDYIIDEGMYCILNVHHDTGDSNTAWLRADENVYAKQKDRFEALWTQIAEEFRDYGDHLLFEGYNEMLDSYGSWCFASFATSSRYDAPVATSAYNAINGYAQSFVNAVRSTGGNNRYRNLIVNTYGACDGRGTWNSHLLDPLKQMKLPTDQVQGHIAFEIHSYLDISNLSSAKSELNTAINNFKTYLVAKGAPVIIGEWGASNGEAYNNNRNNLLNFAKYFVQQTKANNIATFYWMGLCDGENRSVPQFNQQDLVDAIITGYYGDGGYDSGVDPTVMSETVGNQFYDINGRRISQPLPGQVVIQHANGAKGSVKVIKRR
ncbi:MAG: glycoside hydrolase family 5 protein [Prevotella sp.]|nr:glycoside hydrolase family 5 protein [Prevotella sp.]